MAKKIISILGSINANSISNKVNALVVEKLMDKYKNSKLTLINLNNSELANHCLTMDTKATFYQDTNSDFYINRLKENDILVLSAPMFNFNYSSVVKNFIDTICVADKTFSYKYSKKGDAIGYLTNLKVILVVTQGAPKGWYPFGDVAKNLEGTFKFLGVKKVETIFIGGTKVAPLKDLPVEEIIKQKNDEINCVVDKF